MNQESNGQLCQLCHDKVAKTEALCLSIYLCADCLRKPIITPNDKGGEDAVARKEKTKV